MRSILLDESVPRGVVEMLEGRDAEIRHASEIGLAGVDDAEMLRAAIRLGVDVFVTCDQDLVKQNLIATLPFAIVVVCTNNWTTILGNRGTVAATCELAEPGVYVEILKGAHLTRHGRPAKPSSMMAHAAFGRVVRFSIGL